MTFSNENQQEKILGQTGIQTQGLLNANQTLLPLSHWAHTSHKLHIAALCGGRSQTPTHSLSTVQQLGERICWISVEASTQIIPLNAVERSMAQAPGKQTLQMVKALSAQIAFYQDL